MSHAHCNCRFQLVQPKYCQNLILLVRSYYICLGKQTNMASTAGLTLESRLGGDGAGQRGALCAGAPQEQGPSLHSRRGEKADLH